MVPLAPERYKIQLTISRETHDKRRRVQALARHTFPAGEASLFFGGEAPELVGQKDEGPNS